MQVYHQYGDPGIDPEKLYKMTGKSLSDFSLDIYQINIVKNNALIHRCGKSSIDIHLARNKVPQYVFRQEAETSWTPLKFTYADGHVNFNTEHFSKYVILFAADKPAPQPGDDSVTHGDLDSDGFITAADARFALRAAVGLEKLTDIQKKIADADKDGKITAADARKILRAAVGLEKLTDKKAKEPL